ncbi:hypothetical protein C8Q76DRAFT_623736 [Earliella scabrosa]|nr:hypothetical protein C8Q76DRAFT_623736 [Earliella scabrosa]
MNHYCTICNSPFLMDNGGIETETVATTCGHVFHRDCLAQRTAQPCSVCGICGSSLREGNKFTKIFVTYDKDEQDALLANLVKSTHRLVSSATSSALSALHDEGRDFQMQERLKELQEEHQFNQAHIERLDRQLTSVHSLRHLYENRLKTLESKLAFNSSNSNESEELV